ncbi:dihydrolipoamide acetyltransferase family protein [Marinobacterium arenosum]|uniref:dihydrolipoamide acetyltransferase family protein n=1 Tax=Marinobacterium arenosum TaxID=2862496 RepID=UPI001C988545|nr:dihydrolipoamide acetyltransferase family protein [Marinobacterium arenosum]MBY4675995.1 2-oxo acid dehydrogenase subunit E2 [Marinobacterium arenosum]
MKYFKLPDLGEGLPEAEILEWHVKEGDTVKTDQVLVSVETAKAIIEVPSPQDGVIAHLFGQSGDTIHTGEPLVEFANEEQEDSGTVVGKIGTASQESKTDDFIIGAAPSSRHHHGVRATPAVRALAQRLQVDLNTLSGSGRDGAITPEDVQKAAEMDRQHGPAEPLRGVRKQMARTMAQAHSEVVPVTIFDDADIDGWPKGTDITMRLVQAIAAACKREPRLNSWFDGQQLTLRNHESIHLGVAVDTEQGLFVPVLRDIGNRAPEDLRDGLNRLRADVKARTIPPKELQGATITLSNFGTIAGRYGTPIVVPPQVAILGAGVIRREPVAVDDKILLRRILPLSLTFDHRAATGGEAARFMAAVVESLQQPTIEFI